MITRTAQKALHLYYTHLADTLNDAGLDIKKTFEGKDWEIPWTPVTAKELLWRPIQQAVTMKESTTELESKDIDLIFNIISKRFAEKFGLVVEFPSLETLMRKIQNDKKR